MRPVPLDPETGDHHAPSNGAGSRAPIPSRPGWLVATIVVLVGIAALAATVVLSDRTEESAEPIFTAPVPHLGDDGELVLTATAGPEGWTIAWTRVPSSQLTGAVDAIPAPTADAAETPLVDAGSRWRAAAVCTRGTCELEVATVESSALVASIRARSHVWHATIPGRLAWIEGVGDDATLRTASVDPVSGLVIDAGSIAMSGVERLARWDDSGFLVEAAGVRALDRWGALLWRGPGSVLDATSAVVVLRDQVGGWTVVDRSNGSAVISGSPTGEAVRVTRARTGGLESSVTLHGYRHSFTLTDAEEGAEQLLRPAFRDLPTGREIGTRYRLLRDGEGRRFTFQLTRPATTP